MIEMIILYIAETIAVMVAKSVSDSDAAQQSYEHGLPSLSVTVEPGVFSLYDPAHVLIGVTNNTGQPARFLSIYPSFLSLALTQGEKKAIEMLRQQPPGEFQTIIRLDSGGRWQTVYPLYELMRISNSGNFEISYRLSIEFLKGDQGFESRPVVESGSIYMTVRPRTEKDLERLVYDLTLQLRDPGKRHGAIQRLLPICHPMAIKPLVQAWSIASSEEQMDIVDALIRIGTDDALKSLSGLSHTTRSSDVELHLVQRLGFAAGEPLVCRYAIEVWKRGMGSEGEDVRIASVGYFAQYAGSGADREIRRMLYDKSESVRQVAATALKNIAERSK